MLLFAGIFTLTMMSCDKESQAETDDRLIRDYIDANGLDATPTGSGLYYVIEEPGNDQHPEADDRVWVRYTGRFLNGDIFDSSNGDIVNFPLNVLIQGWQEGIPLFGKGGSGILLIPSHLGYGPSGAGSIPGNTVLVFDIELVDFN